MDDPSPRLKKMLPAPDGETAAAKEMRLFTDKIKRLPGRTGISVVKALTVASDPNLMNASALEAFVTTTESPPPLKQAFVDTLPTDTLIVPVGRNGLTEPSGMAMPFILR